MHFARLHHDLLDSPKIGRLPMEAVGFWALCLAHAGRRNPRGTLPADLDALAFAIHRPAEEVERLMKMLVAARLVDVTDDGYAMHDWERHQPTDSSAERTRRYREAKKQKAEDAPDDADVTPSRDDCDASHPSQRHCDGVTVKERRGEENKERKHTPLTPHGGDACAGKPSLSLLKAPESKTPAPPKPKSTPEETERTLDLVAEMFGPDVLAPHDVRSFCAAYPAAWVAEAYTECIGKKAHSLTGLVRTILRGYQAAGGPPAPVPRVFAATGTTGPAPRMTAEQIKARLPEI